MESESEIDILLENRNEFLMDILLDKLTDEQRDLAADNYGLVHSFLNQHPKYRKLPVEFDEIIGEMHLRFCRSAVGFDKDKGFRFSTYAFGGFRFGIRSLLRHKEHPKSVDCFSNEEGIENFVGYSDKVVDRSFLVHVLENSDIPPRTITMIKGHFLEGWTLENVGLPYNLSRERARQLIQDGLLKLHRQLEREDYTIDDFLIERDFPYA